MATYDKNDLLRLQAEFVDVDGSLDDPDEVTIKHKDPSGNTTTLTYVAGSTVNRLSTGKFYIDLELDEVGTWYWRAEGSASPQAAAERSFVVRTTQF